MATITRMVSISRDNIINMFEQPDFFTRNQALVDIQPLAASSLAAFYESAKKAGCRCRADTSLLTNAIMALLDKLEAARQTEPETVQQFIRYVAKAEDIAHTGVTIHYIHPGTNSLRRYVFP